MATPAGGTQRIFFLAPGDPGQLTGGYIYNRRIAVGLEGQGYAVEMLGLEGTYPDTDPATRRAADQVLTGIPDDAPVVLDGLALGGLPEVVAGHSHRLRLIALVHHPLADEAGLPADTADRLRVSEVRALAQVRGIIVTSRFTARRLRAFNVKPGLIRVVEPGVDTAPKSRGSATPRLLCVASLIPRKAQATLVQALAGLKHIEWRCELIGSCERDAAYARQVEDRIEQLDLGERIQVAGELPQDELARAYARANLFVLPSLYEGYGMVVSEALARGLPVVTTSGGALAETLPQTAGITVPPGDVRALSDALQRLLENPAELARCRHGALAVREKLRPWSQAAGGFGAALTQFSRDTDSLGMANG